MTDFDRDASRVSRRKLLQAGVGAAVLGAVPGALQRSAHAQAPFDWKKFVPCGGPRRFTLAKRARETTIACRTEKYA